MAESLHVTGVRKSYGDKVVLNDLSFTGEQGQFMVLVGPSGCGRSTMLRSIAGLEAIDEGQIVIGGKDVTALAPKDRDIAMVFQDYALYPHKSVYENIAFGLRIRGLKEATIDAKVREAAAKLDLDPYLQRKPAALSGGQRQRVAIGRAIVRDPKVFLFDEPLSNLDAKLRGSMRLTIAKLHKELGATVVYVTHDQVEAMTLADRIIVMNHGDIQQIGTPLDLYYKPANVFVATFIGSPPMNVYEGQLLDEGGSLWFMTTKGWRVRLPDNARERLGKAGAPVSPLLWGVRPEDLGVATDAEADSQAQEDQGRIFTAEVLVSEMLGAHSSFYGNVAGHELQAVLTSGHRPQRGEMIKLRYKAKHLYLFEKTSGASLL